MRTHPWEKDRNLLWEQSLHFNKPAINVGSIEDSVQNLSLLFPAKGCGAGVEKLLLEAREGAPASPVLYEYRSPQHHRAHTHYLCAALLCGTVCPNQLLKPLELVLAHHTPLPYIKRFMIFKIF